MFSNNYKIMPIVILCFLASMTPAVFASGMGDPLRPPDYATIHNGANSASSEPVWWVNEILFSGGRRVAIVNNVAVVVGDHVNGAKIVDIKPEHVVLKYKDGLINTRLHTMLVKKQSLKKQID